MRISFLFRLSIVLLSIFFNSCKKAEGPNSKSQKLADAKPPEGFNWESTSPVKLNVNIADTRFGDAAFIISVYDGKGNLYVQGAASKSSSFAASFKVSGNIDRIYVIKTAPDNSNDSQALDLPRPEADLTFTTPIANPTSYSKSSSKTLFYPEMVDPYDILIKQYNRYPPNCNSECSKPIILTSDNQVVTVEDGKSICINSSDKTFDIEFGPGGGKVNICGSGLVVKSVKFDSGSSPCSIILSTETGIHFQDLRLTQLNHMLINMGYVTASKLYISTDFVNSGSLAVDGPITIEGGRTLVNEGTLVSGSLEVVNGTFFNKRSANVGELTVLERGIISNTCKLTANNLNVKKLLSSNGGSILVKANTRIYPSSKVELTNSVFSTANIVDFSGEVTGTYSVVKVPGYISQDAFDAGIKKITGNIQLCYSKLIPPSFFGTGARQGCNLFIQPNICTEGNGEGGYEDPDRDGIWGSFDQFPNDPERAFYSYYPYNIAESSGHYNSLLFEDMWPQKGDFDMNDLVFRYQLRVITNAQNRVVEVKGKYVLEARGGIFPNGFGIEFPVSTNGVESVQGATLEKGQTRATLIFFKNSLEEMNGMNTIKGEAYIAPKTYEFILKLKNGPRFIDFGFGEYNPFIFRINQGQRYEIHLPGRTATDLVTKSLFGTFDDAGIDSRINRPSYVTKDGLPYAICTPGGIRYPREGYDIGLLYNNISLYPGFTGWFWHPWGNMNSEYSY
ncbi:LruC domain-containing protein [Desertivirga brevis]|uniref:LruC domain-containing protein n=1 Tax=Desertivirga brevis TaxID=2810310 RepID=UPI001A96E063|nr:LruC domain-containing protein [Pedobacter sp. SYSU D00873]